MLLWPHRCCVLLLYRFEFPTLMFILHWWIANTAPHTDLIRVYSRSAFWERCWNATLYSVTFTFLISRNEYSHICFSIIWLWKKWNSSKTVLGRNLVCELKLTWRSGSPINWLPCKKWVYLSDFFVIFVVVVLYLLNYGYGNFSGWNSQVCDSGCLTKTFPRHAHKFWSNGVQKNSYLFFVTQHFL